MQKSDISAKVRQSCSSAPFSLHSKQLQPGYVSSHLLSNIEYRMSNVEQEISNDEVFKQFDILLFIILRFCGFLILCLNPLILNPLSLCCYLCALYDGLGRNLLQ